MVRGKSCEKVSLLLIKHAHDDIGISHIKRKYHDYPLYKKMQVHAKSIHLRYLLSFIHIS